VVNRHYENSVLRRSHYRQIVERNPINIKEFVFSVSIEVNDGYICVRLLIPSDILFTAAHYTGKINLVCIGGHNENMEPVETGISNECTHPNFSNKSKVYDFKLLKLKSSIDINEYPPIQVNKVSDFPKI
jgi:hypothetical protein